MHIPPPAAHQPYELGPASSKLGPLGDTQHPKLWFHDGSIILRVDTCLFRVHQTVLAAHSEVFADLFLIPQPPGEYKMDGCHLVELHDNSDDFADLLNGIYDPSHFQSLSPNADLDTVLDFVAGILRLSTKYAIESLRKKCIQILISKFPTTFHDYTIKCATNTERYKSSAVMRAINLAHELTVSEVLPYAYYCCARMSIHRLLKHSPKDVSWQTKALCLAARERIRLAQMSISHSFLLTFKPYPECTSRPLCSNARGPHAEWHVLEAAKSPNPLREYVRWNMMNVCRECITGAYAEHQAGRAEVWQLLPSFFELPPWEELKVMQEQ
ncbi:hypothetical protein BD779DRAFT_1671469 [Infundibulicybe gibba]|nr:hypothetical protein BD779DRAFT_1671469 [Infundibulicybe gibba]